MSIFSFCFFLSFGNQYLSKNLTYFSYLTRWHEYIHNIPLKLLISVMSIMSCFTFALLILVIFVLFFSLNQSQCFPLPPLYLPPHPANCVSVLLVFLKNHIWVSSPLPPLISTLIFITFCLMWVCFALIEGHVHIIGFRSFFAFQLQSLKL